NPFLTDALDGYIAELKSYLPTSSAAVIETTSEEPTSFNCLAGEVSTELALFLAANLSTDIRSGQPLVMEPWAIFPVLIFHRVEHFLVCNTAAAAPDAGKVGGGLFASRIGAAMEFHRISHRLVEFESGPRMLDKAQFAVHAIRGMMTSIAM